MCFFLWCRGLGFRAPLTLGPLGLGLVGPCSNLPLIVSIFFKSVLSTVLSRQSEKEGAEWRDREG